MPWPAEPRLLWHSPRWPDRQCRQSDWHRWRWRPQPVSPPRQTLSIRLRPHGFPSTMSGSHSRSHCFSQTGWWCGWIWHHAHRWPLPPPRHWLNRTHRWCSRVWWWKGCTSWWCPLSDRDPPGPRSWTYRSCRLYCGAWFSNNRRQNPAYRATPWPQP